MEAMRLPRPGRALAASLALALLAFGGAALASACGGDNGGSSASAADRTPSPKPEIDHDDLKFSPNDLTVRAGTEVVFKNSETALHTVTINKKNESGNMKKSGEYRWTPSEPGTYKITCDYHPQMRAT